MLNREVVLGLFVVCSPLEAHIQQGFSVLVVKVATGQVNRAPLTLPLPLNPLSPPPPMTAGHHRG